MNVPGPADEQPPGPSPWSFVGLGFEVVAPILLGLYLGARLDRWVDSSPWFQVGGALAGIAASMWSLVRRVRGQQR